MKLERLLSARESARYWAQAHQKFCPLLEAPVGTDWKTCAVCVEISDVGKGIEIWIAEWHRINASMVAPFDAVEIEMMRAGAKTHLAWCRHEGCALCEEARDNSEPPEPSDEYQRAVEWASVWYGGYRHPSLTKP